MSFQTRFALDFLLICAGEASLSPSDKIKDNNHNYDFAWPK